MTVIAWDGKSLAADKRACIGGLIRTTTKIFALWDCLAGHAGDADAGEEMLAWFMAGKDPAKFPEAQRDRENYGGLLIVWPDGSLWKYERTPHPVKFPPQQFAVGSGRDFALAAMHLGKSAAEAVEVACVFESGCGNGVDVLTHKDRPFLDVYAPGCESTDANLRWEAQRQAHLERLKVEARQGQAMRGPGLVHETFRSGVQYNPATDRVGSWPHGRTSEQEAAWLAGQDSQTGRPQLVGQQGCGPWPSVGIFRSGKW